MFSVLMRYETRLIWSLTSRGDTISPTVRSKWPWADLQLAARLAAAGRSGVCSDREEDNSRRGGRVSLGKIEVGWGKL